MKKYLLILAVITLAAHTDIREMFVSPVDIPVSLSANFGELRPDHFHSGIDIKTNGVTGQRVLSSADGYVYRVAVSPSGFGKALYVRHDNGLSTVYGHLDGFIPEISEYVIDEQYRRKSFSVDLFPPADKFRFKKGELIAYSGNSGSSQGPHLHYEIRRSSNENPVDPLKYIDVPDNIRPIIDRIIVYPAARHSAVNGYNEKVKFTLTGDKGKYTLSSPSPVLVSGEVGIGISTWDYINNSWNKCGVRSVEMKLDGVSRYKHSLDEFSFAESRYINSHIDYAEQVRSRSYFQKTFLDPNNKLSIYEHTDARGIISLNDNELHKVELIVEDYSGNISRVSFLIALGDNINSETGSGDVSRVIPFAENAEFNRHDIRLSFPSNCFYDTLFFIYKKTPPVESLLSDIHYVHNIFTPVHKSFEISIKPFDVEPALYDKLCLVNVYDRSFSYAGGSFSDGFVSGSARSLGNYAVGIDTVSPVLRPVNFSKGADIRGRNGIRIFMDDDFSGIASYNVTIDGNWVLFEWDPKNRSLSCSSAQARVKKGTDHLLEAVATDNLGNSTTLNMNFKW